MLIQETTIPQRTIWKLNKKGNWMEKKLNKNKNGSSFKKKLRLNDLFGY